MVHLKTEKVKIHNCSQKIFYMALLMVIALGYSKNMVIQHLALEIHLTCTFEYLDAPNTWDFEIFVPTDKQHVFHLNPTVSSYVSFIHIIIISLDTQGCAIFKN